MSFWSRIKSLLNLSTPSSSANLGELERIVGHRFADIGLLEHSLTHRSYINGDFNRDGETSRFNANERLEFLGDSVLGLVIARKLFEDHPDLREGELTKMKAQLVNETALFDVGTQIGLNRFILLSPEEDRSGGRERPSIVSDAFESVIAAVYLDGGIEAATTMILKLIYSRKESIISDRSQRNFKGELLELVQSRGQGMPHYDVVKEEGPDHHKIFHIEVIIAQTLYGEGHGNSKKEAEQQAAADALEKYMNS